MYKAPTLGTEHIEHITSVGVDVGAMGATGDVDVKFEGKRVPCCVCQRWLICVWQTLQYLSA